MKIQRQREQRRFSKRGISIYLSYLTLLLGQGMLLVHLLLHRSLFPVILGRYSAKFSLLLGIVVLVFAVSIAWGVMRWRRLPDSSALMGALLDKRPGLLAAVTVLGGALVASALTFHKILATVLRYSGRP